MTSSEYLVFLGSFLNTLEDFKEIEGGHFSLQITLQFGPTNQVLVPVPWGLSSYLVLLVPAAILIPGLIDGSATDSLGCSSHALLWFYFLLGCLRNQNSSCKIFTQGVLVFPS